MYPFNYMYAPGVYSGPSLNGGKKLVSQCAYAPTYCPEYPHCLEWYEDGSYDCNFCCVGYQSKNVGFLADPPTAVIRTLEYYKTLQQQNPNALAPLVQQLNSGIKVPLPCSDDPNLPCMPSGGIQTYSFSIVDQLKGCVGLWPILFFGPTINGPFTMLTLFISSLQYDAAGNVIAMDYFLPNNNFPQRITIQQLIFNGLRALQC